MTMMNDSADVAIGGTYTRVRGGGYGRDAWIARITALHPKYVFEREFCSRSTGGLSSSGRSGIIRFEVTEPGIYEFRHFCVGSTPRNWEWSGFCELTEDGEFREMTRSEVLARFRPD
jgi:hypothetical protein